MPAVIQRTLQFFTLTLAIASCSPLLHGQAAWKVGDVFVGVGHGKYARYSNGGTDASPNYVLSQTLVVSGSNDQTSGCAWDSHLNFYGTGTTSGKVFEVDGNSQTIAQTLATGAGTTSVMFDAQGNLYVGLAKAGLLKYVPGLPAAINTGTFVYPAAASSVFNKGKNSDWIDLSQDQKTLYLTGETSSVEQEDLSAASPTPSTFSTPSGNEVFGVRLLAPFDGSGGFLVAASSEVLLLDSQGKVLATYAFGRSSHLQALTLDPNGTSAWVADFKTGDVYRFNIKTGSIEFTISTTGNSAPNGVCVRGGPELNVVPLIFSSGTNVTETASFGGSANLHNWTARIGQVLQPFVLVVTATEMIDLRRFDEYFCNQAQFTSNNCATTWNGSPTMKPIPTTDGKPVVYRVANPQDVIADYNPNAGLFIYASYTAGPYTLLACPPPPGFTGTITPMADPRALRAPSSPLNGNDSPDVNFTYDFTTFTDLDAVMGGGSSSFNDYTVADRCPASSGNIPEGGSSMAYSSLKTQVTLGSSLPISVIALDAFGHPITNLVTSPENLSLSITQNGVPLTSFGVEGNSPDFFKITADNKYKANLSTGTVQGLQPGPAALCITSYQVSVVVGTSQAPASTPPVCADVTFVP